MEEPDSESCSPDKNDMSIDKHDELSYDGDSDMGDKRRSKLKKKRSKKHHRKEKMRQSPSPKKNSRNSDDLRVPSYDSSPDSKAEYAR